MCQSRAPRHPACNRDAPRGEELRAADAPLRHRPPGGRPSMHAREIATFLNIHQIMTATRMPGGRNTRRRFTSDLGERATVGWKDKGDKDQRDMYSERWRKNNEMGRGEETSAGVKKGAPHQRPQHNVSYHITPLMNLKKVPCFE